MKIPVNSKKLQSFLPIIIFFAGMLPILYNLGNCGLLEPNEGLIASVARQMNDSNDMSTPMVNNVKHFELPPGVYWITSLGLRLFGNTELGARFFLSVAAGVTAVCIYFIAKLFFGMQCAIIAVLLLCTSLLYQFTFRILSVSAYSVAFESILCLVFFYYLYKPSNALRLTFWIALSSAFIFSGFGSLLPIIAVTIVAIYTGQEIQIKKLYKFIPGISTFVVFGLGWYAIQIIINTGLFSYLLFSLPFNNIFTNHNGVSFLFYLILPFFAVYPWSAFLFKEVRSKLPELKENPAVAYLIGWAALPFFIRLCMTSRETCQFMSSLPPLVLLTAPAFQNIYFNKGNPSENVDEKEALLKECEERRFHNLFIIVTSAFIGMISSIWGYIHFENARVVSQTMIFTGIFWLFSSMIMLAFMIKKLNKSVLIPAAVLVPSVILFTVPAITGNEPIDKGEYLSSKSRMITSLSNLPKEQEFVCCSEPLNAWYFYTGRTIKELYIDRNFNFVTAKGFEYIMYDQDTIDKILKPEDYMIMPFNQKDKISAIIKKNLEIKGDPNDWIICSQGGNL